MSRAAEYLRQAREAFDQNKAQSQRWFDLRLRTGYVLVGLDIVMAIASTILMFAHAAFPDWVLGAAAVTMPSGIAGTAFIAWRLILG